MRGIPPLAPVPLFQGRGGFVAPQDLHFHTKDWCQKRSDLFFYAKININKRKRNTKKKKKDMGRARQESAETGTTHFGSALGGTAPPSPRPGPPALLPAALPGQGLAWDGARGGSPL